MQIEFETKEELQDLGAIEDLWETTIRVNSFIFTSKVLTEAATLSVYDFSCCEKTIQFNEVRQVIEFSTLTGRPTQYFYCDA